MQKRLFRGTYRTRTCTSATRDAARRVEGVGLHVEGDHEGRHRAEDPPWHDLRRTALTHDAAGGNPAVYVQARAGHAQATMTERYVHAAQVAFPGAAERAEERIFSASSLRDQG
jgi:integrase